jgi:6-methylpretetramide 4-monooxygenase / 4-hydroxy-6-methylpretetramide 12a-monooxygenase
MNTASQPLEAIRSRVLVVGAGPVGLMAALRLAQRGIEVRIIEQQPEHRAHSFPVVLHPGSVRLLREAGLEKTLLWRGRSVSRLAVYTEAQRRAVLEAPGGLFTLPQDVLRQALAAALAERGVPVAWNVRLLDLQQDQRLVWGRLQSEGTSRELQSFEADYVIGADGYESTVREALGIKMVEHGPLQTFAFFDAQSGRSGHEAQLVIADAGCCSVYPLQDNISRFSFQISRALGDPLDASAFRELLTARLPWYGQESLRCEAVGVAEFRCALAERLGEGRVWLSGEAAHLIGPLGVDGLNVGLDEANELAERIELALKRPGQPSFGPLYEGKRRRQWLELLGASDQPLLSERSPEWALANAARLVPCLPASGPDLHDFLDQLRLTPRSGRPSASG